MRKFDSGDIFRNVKDCHYYVERNCYMIKVIKYGKKRRALCEHCESLLEFEKEDIKTVQTGMNEWEKQITCPVCDTPVSVRE